MAETPQRLPVTKALVAMLEQATGKPVGRGKAPTTDPPAGQTDRPPADPPYTIVDAIPGGYVEAQSMDGRFTYAEWVYQLTSVSAKDDRQAEWLGDRNREAMLARNAEGDDYLWPIDVAGYKVTRRWEDDGGRDGEGGIVSSAERFRLCVTPA